VEELFLDGCCVIFHGQAEQYYKQVLGGDYSPPAVVLATLDDVLPMDVEAEADDRDNLLEDARVPYGDNELDNILANDLQNIMDEEPSLEDALSIELDTLFAKVTFVH
jgi:hypothetical protein